MKKFISSFRLPLPDGLYRNHTKDILCGKALVSHSWDMQRQPASWLCNGFFSYAFWSSTIFFWDSASLTIFSL